MGGGGLGLLAEVHGHSEIRWRTPDCTFWETGVLAERQGDLGKGSLVT